MIIHPHSSVIAPVWSGLGPWGRIYSLVCWAMEPLHTKQLILLRRDHSLRSMEKFEFWRFPQGSDLPVFSFLRVYTAAGNSPWSPLAHSSCWVICTLEKIWLLIQVQISLRLLVVLSAPLVQDAINCIRPFHVKP